MQSIYFLSESDSCRYGKTADFLAQFTLSFLNWHFALTSFLKNSVSPVFGRA